MAADVLDGLLVLDKPGGMTSRAAVDRVLRWFPRRTRIGHTGTLDPLATGVLVLCLGNATRLAEYVQHMSKTYRTRLLLGARSDTDDADGTIAPVPGAQPPEDAALRACVAGFLGVIEQVPPAFSAAKVTGQRAYDLARRGEDVTLQARPVRIDAIEVIEYTYPHLELVIHCGKGTYIRSLARDLGEKLGCGALVQTLRRTRVGPFTTDKAVTLDTPPEMARQAVLPSTLAVAELSRLVLPDAEVTRLCQGQRVALRQVPEGIDQGGEVAVFDGRDRLTAIAAFDAGRKLLQPVKVFGGLT